MRYQAKVDWWIGSLGLFALLFPLGHAIYSRSPTSAGVFLFTAIIFFGLCYPQSYETTETSLAIRAGLRRLRIPYSRITAIRPSSDGRAAMPLSLDRILVEHEAGQILIAPRDQTEFFTDMAARCPQLRRRGQELTIAFT